MIKEQYQNLLIRGLPEKQTKYKKSDNHLTFEKKTKLYEYYICDYCGSEIKIKNKWEKSSGGVILVPPLLIKKPKGITIAVCNRCFNSALKEFEEV